MDAGGAGLVVLIPPIDFEVCARLTAYAAASQRARFPLSRLKVRARTEAIGWLCPQNHATVAQPEQGISRVFMRCALEEPLGICIVGWPGDRLPAGFRAWETHLDDERRLGRVWVH
jgi:hypothetical protein